MKKTKKIIALFMLMIILLPIIQNIVLGASTTLESTKIVRGDVIKTNVKFNGYEVQARYIYYVDENNRKYPAYCISHGYDGVDERGDYTVDINGIVTNEKVWRVIINGYPYKKLDGLTNEEAYFATKQAIFCVLVEGRNANQYEGIGSKGEKIVQAIKELEYIGENGKQKYDNWNITVKTTKKLQQYKDYWYETVNISSNTDIKNFEVTKISNFPEGSFVSDEEINRVVEFVKRSGTPVYDEKMTNLDKSPQEEQKELESTSKMDEDDPLYNEVVEFAVRTGKISASLIQRKYRLGYNRAARIIDLLEERGIIGPQNGSKPREVLFKMNKEETGSEEE